MRRTGAARWLSGSLFSDRIRVNNMGSGEAVLRVPPQSLDAEQSVLGGVLIEDRAITKVLDILTPQDFYREGHRKVFSAMMELFDKNEPVDFITLTEALKKKGTLEESGGIGYITSLVDNVPTAANIQYYAKIVKEKAILRGLIAASSEIIADSYEAKRDVDELLEKAESKIFEISEHKIKQPFSPIQKLVPETMNIIEHLYHKDLEITGVPTGFKDIDDMTAGLQPSDLIIIAGRPSMGKTALALNIALNAAFKHKVPVAIFSLEMSKEQLVMRMLASEARIELNRIRTGKFMADQWTKLTRAAGILLETNIYIDDSSGLNPLEMRAKARRLKVEADIGLVVVDYLQLMTGMGRAERRDLEISEISRSLKAMAKELKVPVVALSQLSRAVESRESKRPMLADLRESGAIEQDADVIAFIYRDEVYNPNTNDKGIAEIIIGKQRNGPTGTTRLTFINEHTRFEDHSKRDTY
jgi:replicative DNA helicase